MTSPFNVTNIIAEISKSGVLRNNKFQVEFSIPPSFLGKPGYEKLMGTNKVLSLYCEQCNIPGMALLTGDIRRYGYGPNEKKPYAPLFTDVSMALRGDAEGKVWAFMKEWSKSIINFEYRDGMTTKDKNGLYPFEVAYKYDPTHNEGYATTTSISVFDDTGTKTPIKVILREAYPIFVGDIPLNWAARSDYMRIPVTMTFFSWYSETNDI